jgi:hypothetical protein
MAFKLDKQEKQRRTGLVEDLRAGAGRLEDAVSLYNDEVRKLREPLEAALAEYNQNVEAARGFAEDIASQAESDIDDKSERWQEGERGEAAAEWKGQWENEVFDEISIDFPEDIEISDADHADKLDALPEEAE